MPKETYLVLPNLVLINNQPQPLRLLIRDGTPDKKVDELLAQHRVSPRANTPRMHYRFLRDAAEAVTQSNSEDIDIVILPPPTGDQPADSDEENEDDALDREGMPEKISGELEVHGNEEEEVENFREKGRWRKRENLSFDLHSVPAGDGEAHLGKGVFEIYKLLFPDEIINHMTAQTNLHAQRDKNDKDFCIDEEDMTKFLGLVLISGYHSVPSENDYWSTSDDLAIPIFPNTMSREKFKSIKKYFYVADDNNLAK
ncbi:piggyBac transposable element-derived protein 2-like [Macrobrachium rosenbergii]|uniref:piggyBac transposable element-derived protein 2-like n=1 Tax=Macrobrachium rosenbergii TaxID=79674 RepID=UPI0034D46511